MFPDPAVSPSSRHTVLAEDLRNRNSLKNIADHWCMLICLSDSWLFGLSGLFDSALLVEGVFAAFVAVRSLHTLPGLHSPHRVSDSPHMHSSRFFHPNRKPDHTTQEPVLRSPSSIFYQHRGTSSFHPQMAYFVAPVAFVLQVVFRICSLVCPWLFDLA